MYDQKVTTRKQFSHRLDVILKKDKLLSKEHPRQRHNRESMRQEAARILFQLLILKYGTLWMIDYQEYSFLKRLKTL